MPAESVALLSAVPSRPYKALNSTGIVALFTLLTNVNIEANMRCSNSF